MGYRTGIRMNTLPSKCPRAGGLSLLGQAGLLGRVITTTHSCLVGGRGHRSVQRNLDQTLPYNFAEGLLCSSHMKRKQPIDAYHRTQDT